MRVLVCGDFHANIRHQEYAYKRAKNLNCEKIMQLGDYGMWPNFDNGLRVMDHALEMYESSGIEMYVIDGNHENHWWLRDCGHAGAKDFSQMQEGLFYVPRGHRWTWGEHSILGMGGAYSIDRLWRQHGVDFFWEELITNTQVNAILDTPGEVDIVFAHDSPIKPPGLVNEWKDDPYSQQNRASLGVIVDHVKPKTLYHGHYHYPYTTKLKRDWGEVQIIGLDTDKTGRASWTMLDL